MTNHKKVNIVDLQREVNLLRSFVIGIIKKDKEGKYRPKFIKEVFRALREKAEYILVGHRKDIYQKF
jgi:hypothetical protein